MNDISIKPVKKVSYFWALIFPMILAMITGIVYAMGTINEDPLIIILSFIPGVAAFVIICVVWGKMVKGINEMCKRDGKHLIPYICGCLLGVVTIGIYALYYTYKMQKRMYDESENLDAGVKTKPAIIVVLTIIGVFITVCAIIACVLMIKSYNRLVNAYHGQNVELWEDAPVRMPATEQLREPESILPQPEKLEAPVCGVMKCVAGIEDGPEIKFDGNRKKATLGRKPELSDIVITNQRVSKVHCDILFDEWTGTFYIVDKNSSNGTLIQGQSGVKKMDPGVPAMIREGDYLLLPDNIAFGFEISK